MKSLKFYAKCTENVCWLKVGSDTRTSLKPTTDKRREMPGLLCIHTHFQTHTHIQNMRKCIQRTREFMIQNNDSINIVITSGTYCLKRGANATLHYSSVGRTTRTLRGRVTANATSNNRHTGSAHSPLARDPHTCARIQFASSVRERVRQQNDCTATDEVNRGWFMDTWCVRCTSVCTPVCAM